MSSKPKNGSRIVYSSDKGTTCPNCGESKVDCKCRQEKVTSSGDGIVRVGRETKGRKGKGVTLIKGLPLQEQELKQLAKRLKAKCGSGGTVKNGVIEIQGDHRNLLMQELNKEGFSVKSTG